jgi:hypothetical protein
MPQGTTRDFLLQDSSCCSSDPLSGFYILIQRTTRKIRFGIVMELNTTVDCEQIVGLFHK